MSSEAPPRSLEELLSHFDHIAGCDKVDASIAADAWASRFMDHLAKRGLDDEITALRFLVATQPFHAKGKKKKDLSKLFKAVVKEFFSSESSSTLVLSNERLFEAFKEDVSAEEQEKLVAKARSDPDVWQNGLEPKFMAFLSKQDGKASTMACILSIL